MSKAEQTRAFIIEKTASVFNRKGYAGTSMSDLTAATGLTKGSIYGNFENKDEVAIAVFDYNIQRINAGLATYINQGAPAYAQLLGYIMYFRNNWKLMFENGGCPVLNASVEADDNLPFLKKYVQNAIKGWATRISSIIELGKKTGEFKKTVNANEYAFTVISLIEGGIMLSKIMNNQNHLFSAADRCLKIAEEELKV